MAKKVKVRIYVGMKDFVGYKLKTSGEDRWIRQPRIEQKHKEDWITIEEGKRHTTPIPSGHKVTRPIKNDNVMEEKNCTEAAKGL